MDEHTFLVNRERAVDYLCSLDKVLDHLFFYYPKLFVNIIKLGFCLKSQPTTILQLHTLQLLFISNAEFRDGNVLNLI